MKNGITAKAVLIPITFGIILSVIMVIAVKPNISALLPVYSGTEFAFFDENVQKSKTAEPCTGKSELGKNDAIGSVKLIGKTIGIKYCCDYSNMTDTLSLHDGGALFGETGCVYLKALSDSGDIINEEKDIDIESIYGNYRYILTDRYTADNEFKILSSPSDDGNSLIIYYQMRDKNGLSSEFRVLVYEEAE